MQRDRLYCVESDGQLRMVARIHVRIVSLLCFISFHVRGFLCEHFVREKNGDYAACLKYSVRIFVESIFKMQRLDVSGAVRSL
jgi:hypothetical protein